MIPSTPTDGSESARRLSTLFVSPYSPYPLNFGGAIRTYNLMRTVHEFSDVSLICFSRDDEPRDELESWCDEVVLVEPTHRNRAALQARSLLSSHSFLHLDHRSDRFQHELTNLLRRSDFDVVVIEHTQMSSYELGGEPVLSVLDLHNIEHELVQRRAAVAGRGVRRAALEIEWRKIKREELAACARFDLVFTTSDRERDLLVSWIPNADVATVPNSIEPSRFGRRSHALGGTEILFVGLTHVDANRDGVRWFVESVFPTIAAAVPDAHFTVVGGSPPPEIAALDARDNVEVTGWVPDIAPYLERATVSVVPLRSGGGTRLKVLESLAAGIPTVSTTIGAEGLDLEPDIDLLIADDPSSFASSVERVLRDPSLQQRLTTRGASTVDERYSWRAQRQRVEAAMRSAIVRTSV